MEFGAFVNFFGAKDGLVHISQLAANRVQKTSDVVKEGDKVKVKLLGFDDRGKTRLSMKVVDQVTGEDLEAKQKTESAAPREAAGESIGEVRLAKGRLKKAALSSLRANGVRLRRPDDRLREASEGRARKNWIVSSQELAMTAARDWCPGRGAAFFMPLRRARTVPKIGVSLQPRLCSAPRRKSYALRCVRDRQRVRLRRTIMDPRTETRFCRRA
jgi:predicted RNA-binding protein with RPS1 domain